MPSIAQQDYLHIVRKGSDDCGAIARLLHGIERGTIFDMIFISGDNVSKIMGYDKNEGNIAYIDALNSEIANVAFNADSTATQYEGLAAIQDAENDYSDVPTLGEAEYGLYESNAGTLICVNGKCLALTIDDSDILRDIALTDNSPAEGVDFVNIAWDDALKLIGLPCAAI